MRPSSDVPASGSVPSAMLSSIRPSNNNLVERAAPDGRPVWIISYVRSRVGLRAQPPIQPVFATRTAPRAWGGGERSRRDLDEHELAVGFAPYHLRIDGRSGGKGIPWSGGLPT